MLIKQLRAITSFNTISDQSNDKLPNSILTTGSAKETLIVFHSAALELELRLSGELEDDKLVFDTIACQTSGRSKALAAHHFNESSDHIVREYVISNSIDLSKFIRNNATSDQARYYSTQAHPRKIVCIRSYETTLLRKLDRSANTAGDVRIELNQVIQDSQYEMRQETRADLERVIATVERIEIR